MKLNLVPIRHWPLEDNFLTDDIMVSVPMCLGKWFHATIALGTDRVRTCGLSAL